MRLGQQQGQAMAEFVVMSAGCLLLLFVLVPVVAKLSDMSYKAHEAARYSAWERTVWYRSNGSDNNLPSQLDDNGYIAMRSDEDLLNTAEQRILSFNQDIRPLRPQDIDTARDANAFWRWTHGEGGRALYVPGSAADSSEVLSQSTPSMAYSIIDGYNKVMGAVAKVLNVISFGKGDEDFLQIAHPTENFYTSSVDIPVSMLGSNLGSRPLFDNLASLNVRANSAVLADGWVAQTSEGEGSHFDEKVDDFVLGTLIDKNPIFQTLQNLIEVVEPSFRDLDLAPVNTDPIPDASPVCNITSGFCYFDE